MKIKKGTQPSLLNLKKAGRKPIHDKGIRHISRPTLRRPSSLHLTVKVLRNKAEIKNKSVLKLLRHAIQRARLQGLKIIHYSLEYDHVHLLIEAENNHILGKGMQALGVSLSKGINRLKNLKGAVYKHRYHFRQITSPRQLKNVLGYIFNNGVKHGTASSIVNPYNSIQAEISFRLFTEKCVTSDPNLNLLLDKGKLYFRDLPFVT